MDFLEQNGDGPVGGGGGDEFAVAVNSGFIAASAESDIGVFRFTGAIDDTSHDGDGDGLVDVVEGVADLADHIEEVDFGAATGGAGDEFRTASGTEVEAGEYFPGGIHFVERGAGERNADGVADAFGEKGAEGE